ncbi:IS630 family transposase [Methylosinus sp. Sm6]|nr:IS630 family transposase [Methylosinus sp. Sm6]MBY6243935.1 IS630 family transposase [Methylosinus sp. Sm6]
MALSMDLREKVMKAIRGGMSCRQAAARFDIGPATAVRWAKRVEITGEVAPGKMGGDRRSQRIEAHADFILAQIKEMPNMTIIELRDALKERHDFAVGYGTMWRFLARHGITRKKKTGHAAEQERDDVAAAREEWFEGELDLDPEKLVFIDETSVSTNMARRFGRGPCGERCRASVPFGHWKTTTLIAALRVDRIDAPMTIDGALDGRSFLAYVEQVLAPTLCAGEIVVLDNVSTHKVGGVGEAIEAKGAKVLYLPPYSPDFNPIEKSFSKIKSVLERIAARTVDALDAAVAQALRCVTPSECTNYFAASGYDAD